MGLWGSGAAILSALERRRQQLHDLYHRRHPGRRLQSNRLSNLGIGHGAIDAGGGYTYFNPQTGHEFSGVLGFTYNIKNTSTQYQSGVDMHFDWGASQFLSKQVMVGLVGYVYKELGCDSGPGDRVGCFQSQVVGVGPQIGFLFPVGDMQGYLNFKAYGEFAAENRPAAGTPGSPSPSRRPRPARLRQQNPSSENTRIRVAGRVDRSRETFAISPMAPTSTVMPTRRVVTKKKVPSRGWIDATHGKRIRSIVMVNLRARAGG